MMRRSIGFFVTLVVGLLVVPLAARPQPPARLPTIGFLGATTPAAQSPWTAAFVQRLHDLGWIDGRTLTTVPWCIRASSPWLWTMSGACPMMETRASFLRPAEP